MKLRVLRRVAIGIVVLLGLFFATDSFTSDERGWNGYKPFAISVGLFAIAAVWSLGGSKPPP
jgi:hypothetical protein